MTSGICDKCWGSGSADKPWVSLRQLAAERQLSAEFATDLARVLETVKYLRGIAERGTGRQQREDESVEQFVLGYVKELEGGRQRARLPDVVVDQANALYHNPPVDPHEAMNAGFRLAAAVLAAVEQKP